VAGACKYGDEPSGSQNSGNFLTSWGPFTFSGRTPLYGVSMNFSLHTSTVPAQQQLGYRVTSVVTSSRCEVLGMVSVKIYAFWYLSAAILTCRRKTITSIPSWVSP